MSRAPLTIEIQRFCGDHDFEPKIGYRCAQIATVKALVGLGLGIAILPQTVRLGEDRKTLHYRQLSGQAPSRDVAIIRHQSRYQSRGDRTIYYAPTDASAPTVGPPRGLY